MGYYNAQGKYVGDDGKTYANYNDALAQANTLRGRRNAERALRQTERDIQDTRMTQNVQGVLKNSIGALFGIRGAYDPGLATLGKRLAGQESQQQVLRQTLNDYRRGMGESSLPGGLSEAAQKSLIDGPEGGKARAARIAAESDALVKEARNNPDHPLNQLFSQPPRRENLSDDANSRDSALTSMQQQYAPGADIWSTDEGKAILEAAKTNTYGGKDQGTLAEFNTMQRQAGIGANPEIIEALGYEKGSPMETWAKAHPALAMREYNKKFGNSGVFSPDAYEGEGSGDANTVLPNGMTAREDALNAAAIMDGTGQITESNNQQTREIQNPEAQSIGGLNGMNMLQETMRKHFQKAAAADRLF